MLHLSLGRFHSYNTSGQRGGCRDFLSSNDMNILLGNIIMLARNIQYSFSQLVRLSVSQCSVKPTTKGGMAGRAEIVEIINQSLPGPLRLFKTQGFW